MTEEQKDTLKGFDGVLQAMAGRDMRFFAQIARHLFHVPPESVVRHDYDVAGEKWHVWESPEWKTVGNDSKTYHEFFSKTDGFTVKFGRMPEEDAEWCPLGPDILDLEVSTNQCTPVGGRNCRFCYKSNTSGPGKNMSLATFNDIVSKFPKNLCQIAFGITSLHANGDWPEMVRACRRNGIVPNVTTSGADLSDDMLELITENMGACAVSCYETDPELCYRSIKRIYDYAALKKGREFHVNMHLLFAPQNFDFVMKTLRDVRDGKVPGLRSVVLLRLKPCGNAAKLDAAIPYERYLEVIRFCLDNGISYGFDSCSAKTVIKALHEIGRDDLVACCESCESSCASAYINVDGMYTSCSFVERRPDVITPVSVLDAKSFTEVWHSPEVERIRKATLECRNSCPWYKLDD